MPPASPRSEGGAGGVRVGRGRGALAGRLAAAREGRRTCRRLRETVPGDASTVRAVLLALPFLRHHRTRAVLRGGDGGARIGLRRRPVVRVNARGDRGGRRAVVRSLGVRAAGNLHVPRAQGGATEVRGPGAGGGLARAALVEHHGQDHHTGGQEGQAHQVNRRVHGPLRVAGRGEQGVGGGGCGGQGGGRSPRPGGPEFVSELVPSSGHRFRACEDDGSGGPGTATPRPPQPHRQAVVRECRGTRGENVPPSYVRRGPGPGVGEDRADGRLLQGLGLLAARGGALVGRHYGPALPFTASVNHLRRVGDRGGVHHSPCRRRSRAAHRGVGGRRRGQEQQLARIEGNRRYDSTLRPGLAGQADHARYRQHHRRVCG